MTATMTTQTAALDAAAERINKAHRRVLRAGHEAVMAAIEAGEELIETKPRVKASGHDWLPWLGANFDGHERTAQLYMWVARRAEDAKRVSHLGVGGAVRALREAARDPVTHALIRRAADSERPERALVLTYDGVEIAPDEAAASSARQRPEVRGYLAAVGEVLDMLAEVERGDCDLKDIRRRLLWLRCRALEEGAR
jgi:hypothetical protein